MPKDRSTQAPDISQALQMMTLLPSPATFMAPQAQSAWKTQGYLMNEWERYVHSWFQRRHAAAESAQRCVESLHKASNSGGGQMNEAVSEFNTWMSDEMQRLSSDAIENIEFCMHCFELMSQNATSAGKEFVEEVQETTSAAAKASNVGVKTTPV